MTDNNYIKIFDTTLRDGEQAPGFSMTKEEKVCLAIQLQKLQVDVIEAGFPSASPDDFLAVQKIAQAITKSEVCGLCRALDTDIKTAWEAIKLATKPRLHTFIATSPIHLRYKLKKTPEQALEMTKKAVSLAKSLCDRVDFSPEDAGRSDRSFLVKIITAAIAAGADTINIPDTVGYLTPDEFADLITYLRSNVPGAKDVIWSTHCHDDLGLAVANSLAGIKAGARQIECTINGCGERAGNASLEECVMALKTRKDFYGLKTGIKTTELYPSSKLLQRITGQRVQSNKAIVGDNAFAHEAGIHQHGVLAHRETYEIMTPASVGLKNNTIVLGKHSGRAALENHLHTLGYHPNAKDLDNIFTKFKALADKKKIVTDGDIDIICASIIDNKPDNEQWILCDYAVKSGDCSPSATITLTKGQKIRTVTAEGTGMVDAAYKAIENICGQHGVLSKFSMNSVTTGLNAQAIVLVTLSSEESHYIGKAKDTDIIKAAILAYLVAINARLTNQPSISAKL